MINIAVHKVGTYALQSLIEQTTQESESSLIVNTLTNYTEAISKDLHGTHVIEKLLLTYKENISYPISSQIIQHLMVLANHPHGLCTVKALITATTSKLNKDALAQAFADNALSYIQSPYGNYAIQLLFELWESTEIDIIIVQLEGKMATLAMQKFSSNVIEKLIEKSRDYGLIKFVYEIENGCRTLGIYNINFRFNET